MQGKFCKTQNGERKYSLSFKVEIIKFHFLNICGKIKTLNPFPIYDADVPLNIHFCLSDPNHFWNETIIVQSSFSSMNSKQSFLTKKYIEASVEKYFPLTGQYLNSNFMGLRWDFSELVTDIHLV